MPPPLDQLLSLLSHELRAPVGVIRGYLGLLDDAPDAVAERHRPAVAGALRAVERAAALLDEASALARAYRGDITLEKRPVAAPRLLRAAARALALRTAPIDVVVTGVDQTVVTADEGRVCATLVSLAACVSRAYGGDRTVEISAHASDTGTGTALLVRIIGSGAPDDRVEAGEPDLTRGGLGLELPIAAAIVAAHGGDLRELRRDDRLHGFIVRLPGN